MDEGNWQKSNIFTHIDEPFYELDNKRVGVIGLGEIGRILKKKHLLLIVKLFIIQQVGKIQIVTI